MRNPQKTHINKPRLSIDDPKYTDCLSKVYDLIISADQVNDNEEDLTTKIAVTNPSAKSGYQIIAKQKGKIAGITELKFFEKNKKLGSLNIKFFLKDGSAVKQGQTVATLTGTNSDILKYERFILNFLQRMSGIATATSEIVQSIAPSPVLICPTRKTLWGLLDKKAVLIGGGGTHRLSLQDGVLVKENHFHANKCDFAESLEHIVKTYKNQSRFIEIEVENMAEVKQAASAINKLKNPCLLLDNFTPNQAAAAIKHLRQNHPNIIVEISGGITPKNLKKYAALKPDIISMGYLTNTPHTVDISMRGI